MILSEKEKTMLAKAAAEAVKRAYAPYSGFQVGAALLTESGKVYTGCNIENASYSATVCAERCAFFEAVAKGERGFRAIAVAGGKNGVIDGICVPCGVCLQVMCEFTDAEAFPVLLVKDPDGTQYESHLLKELLPFGFTGKKLNG